MTSDTTKLVTGGRRKEWTSGIVNPPVYRASTCIFESYGELQERNKDPYGGHLYYGRKGTPTQWALAEAITELEGGDGTTLYPSGVSAVTCAILACVKAGDHILITDSAYDPTRYFANSFLKRMGVETTYFDPRAGKTVTDLFQDNTAAIMIESPGSLTFEVQDLPALAAAAKQTGIKVIVDNTWATPLFLKPLALGADISVHACTKYFCGHSDVMIGSATASKDMFTRLRSVSTELGQTVSPDDAYLTLRGLRTMGVRLKQHEAAALEIARWLEEHDLVHEVRYPALPSSPDHALWKRDFTGASGLFSFVVKAGRYSDCAAMVDHMKYFKMGFSWGGYESLILPSDPARCRSATDWKAPGPLFRLHIGLEDIDDLKADLAEGLERYRAQIKS